MLASFISLQMYHQIERINESRSKRSNPHSPWHWAEGWILGTPDQWHHNARKVDGTFTSKGPVLDSLRKSTQMSHASKWDAIGSPQLCLWCFLPKKLNLNSVTALGGRGEEDPVQLTWHKSARQIEKEGTLYRVTDMAHAASQRQERQKGKGTLD